MANPQFEETMKRQAELAQEVGRRYAEKPKFVEEQRKELYGKETILPKLRQTRDQAIMELWEADKQLASTYADPTSDLYVEQPLERLKYTAQRHQDIFGQVSQLTREEETRQDILGDILERGVKMWEFGLTALEKESDLLDKLLGRQIQIAGMEETKATKGKKEIKEKTIANAISTLLSAGIDISNPLDVYQSAVELGIDPTLIPSIVSNISSITAKPGVPTGGYELTDEEIAAGVETFDPKEVRNKKIAQYLKDRDDPVKQIQALKDEGYSKKDVENYIKQKAGGVIPISWQNAINQIYEEEKSKDFVPDWIPFLGKL